MFTPGDVVYSSSKILEGFYQALAMKNSQIL